jgi:hypothetical protein
MAHPIQRVLTTSLQTSLLVAVVATVPAWGAATLTLPAVNPPNTVLANGQLTATAMRTTCQIAPAVTTGPCLDTAFVSTTLATTNSTFLTGNFNGVAPPQTPSIAPIFAAFNTWNAGAGQNDWSIVSGGNLNNLTLTVNSFTAAPNGPVVAGMRIGVQVTGNAQYSGPAMNHLVWTQVSYENYFPASSSSNPTTSLDEYSTKAGSANPAPFNQSCVSLPANGAFPSGGVGTARGYCDPIFPFQGLKGTASFVDEPTGPWAAPASFRAIALLSTVKPPTFDAMGNLLTRGVLTVYDAGIDYGFDLKTPEPGFKVVLSLMAIGAIYFKFRRRPAKS